MARPAVTDKMATSAYLVKSGTIFPAPILTSCHASAANGLCPRPNIILAACRFIEKAHRWLSLLLLLLHHLLISWRAAAVAAPSAGIVRAVLAAVLAQSVVLAPAVVAAVV